jgi:general secretion pathway protein G
MMLAAPSRRNAAVRRSAFTLLEVLVVVAILVILAGVASISVFQYMEKAKIGRAKSDMATIIKAYETYYTQNSTWPQSPQDPGVLSLLSQGQSATIDPWGNGYQVNVVDVQQPDGTMIQRPVAVCHPPGGQQPIQVPER